MRILHTADWHLGHRLYENDRGPEHDAALAWLLRIVTEEAIDLVIVAGDIFDVSNPSNAARTRYYKFLSNLIETGCSCVVIVGGNHDSALMLDAVADFARARGVHVIGAARDAPDEQVIPVVRKTDGRLLGYVAAAPYLRERDVRAARFGESAEERLDNLKSGIRDHYARLAEAARRIRTDPNLPVVTTGHLFASGASDGDDKPSYIYGADEHNITTGDFDPCFDYVALGHVHRSQSLDDDQRICYSGSLVPLSFEEGRRQRSVRIVELTGAGRPVDMRKVAVPDHRRLQRFHGPLKEVLNRLRSECADCLKQPDAPVRWAEVRVVTDDPIPNLREKLLAAVADSLPEGAEPPLRIVFFNTVRSTPAAGKSDADEDPRQLEELEPTEVFIRICEHAGLSEDGTREVRDDFNALISYCREADLL